MTAMKRAICIAAWCAACNAEPSPAAAPTASATASAAPTVAPPIAWTLPSLLFLPAQKPPPNNPLTAEKVVLGKMLFFDKRLGDERACADCHQPDRGWADGIALSKRPDGTLNTRHTPSLYNAGYQRFWGWDGRSSTLEEHVREQWSTQLSASLEQSTARIAADAGYDPLFKTAFGDHAITTERVVLALASFVRSIRSGNAPYDRFEEGDASAIDDAAQRGWLVFRDKAGCTACHVPPLFTDNVFHNIGIGTNDEGRAGVTKKASDTGKYKTPTLRSAAQTAPYFHYGSAATLEAAVDYMLSGGRARSGREARNEPTKTDRRARPSEDSRANPHLDSSLTKVVLTPTQRAELVAFIRSLDGARP